MREEIIGDARLILGDCLEILPTLGKVDSVVTDPPYGVNLSSKSRLWNGESRGGYSSFDDTEENIKLVCVKAIEICRSIADCVVLTPGVRNLFNYPKPDDIGTVFNIAGAGRGPWGFNGNNPILYYGKDPYLARGLGSRPSSWNQPPNDFSEHSEHPCPKPIKMMQWLVTRASLEGQTILDPFMGSGTTGVACANLGRKFIGIEIEPKYFDIACKRIEIAYQQPRLFDEPRAVQQELGL